MSAPYYRLFPREWDDGTMGLTLEQEGALVRICNAINSRGAPIPDDEKTNREMAHRCRVSYRKWLTIKAALLDAGKIEAIDGHLHQWRALSEVQFREDAAAARIENGAKGGRKRAENRAKTSRKPAENPLKTARKQNKNDGRSNENRALAQAEPEPEPEVSTNVDTKARKRAVRLPADWTLPDDWFQVALDIGLDPDVIREEADEIRDWSHSSPKGAKLDWLATWRTWCRRVKREKESENRNPNGYRSEQQRRIDDRRSAISEAIHEARNRR